MNKNTEVGVIPSDWEVKTIGEIPKVSPRKFKQFGKPIRFAEVKMLGSNHTTETDSLGSFQLWIVNSGLQCYCKSRNKATISSPFYLTRTFKLNKTEYKLQAETNKE